MSYVLYNGEPSSLSYASFSHELSSNLHTFANYTPQASTTIQPLHSLIYNLSLVPYKALNFYLSFNPHI